MKKAVGLIRLIILLGLLDSWLPTPALASGNQPISPQTAEQPAPLDWAIPSGHFYTQANGFPLGTSPMGYPIVDDSQARFWTAFQRLGGVSRLGYPASRRFLWSGFVTQITQKAVLQWRPETGTVDFVNVFDDLSRLGKDSWLQAFQGVPTPLAGSFDAGKQWPQVVDGHLDLLKANPALDRAYRSADDPLDLYGLPTSSVVDVGPMYVIRLQRAVLQQWKVAEPWAGVGQVTVANAGDVAKQSGVFPADALRPTSPPTLTWVAHFTQYSLVGEATWYGPGFAGKLMADGKIYDPNDPTTTAANAFPLGSQVKVTSERTGKSILVSVQDTGGFAYPRVVDLSPAAFALLGVSPEVGIQDVSVSIAAPPAGVSSSTQAPPAR